MNVGPKVKLYEVALWAFTGFVWWSWAHFLVCFLPGKVWMPGLPTIILGTVMGIVAYTRFTIDIRDSLPSKVAYIRANLLMFALGFLGGAILGWQYTLGTPLGIPPVFAAPPSSMNRLWSMIVVGVIGLLANSGMMLSLGKLGGRPWVLFSCLIGATVLLYIVVPIILFSVVGIGK